MKVSKIMNKDPAVIFGGDTVQKAAEIMTKKNRGLLAVLNTSEERKVIGVITNKDIVNKAISKKMDPSSTTVAGIMTKDILSVTSDSATSDAMLLMRKYHIKRVLVIDNGVLQGIVSSNDIIDAMIMYKKQLLDMALDF